MPASVTSSTRCPATRASTSPAVRPPRCPRSRRRPARPTSTPRSVVSRSSRRVSSAATTSAAASSSREPGRGVRRAGRSGSPPAPAVRSPAHARRWARRQRARRPTSARRLTAVTRAGSTATARRPDAPRPGGPPACSRTADGRAVPAPSPARAAALRTTRWSAGWSRSAVTAAGRLPAVLEPRPRRSEFAFDETYYAKDGWSLWQHGYAQNWVEKPTTRSSTGARPGPADRRPDDGGAPRGRQVADRARRAALRLRAVRVAGRQRGRRHAHGAGHGPAGAAADRLDAARRRGRAAAVLRRPALRALPAGPARHLRRVLPAQRGLLPGRRPRLGPRAAGRLAERTPVDPLGWGPVRGLRWRPWRLAAGVLFGLADLVQVERRWSRWPGSGCSSCSGTRGARRSLGVRGAFLRSAVVDGLPAFGYLVGGRVRRLRRVVDRVADARRRLRGGAGPQQLRPLLGRLHEEGPRRVLPVAGPGAAQPVALPPRRLVVPQRRAGRRDPLLPVLAAGLAGHAPAGRGRHRARHRARGPGLHAPRRTAPACARSSCSARRCSGGAAWWRCSTPLYALGGPPRLAVRRRAGRRSPRPGCRSSATPTGRSSRSTRSPSCRSRSWSRLPRARPGARAGARPSTRRRLVGAVAAGAFVVLVVLQLRVAVAGATPTSCSRTPDWLDRIWFRSWI